MTALSTLKKNSALIKPIEVTHFRHCGPRLQIKPQSTTHVDAGFRLEGRNDGKLADGDIFYRGDVWHWTRLSRVKLSGTTLIKWYKEQAAFLLPARGRKLAMLHGLSYEKVSVRVARRRWGSCSSNKRISLNSKLILAPDYVLDAIILHELVHTEHMNHGKAFWTRLYELCPLWDKAHNWLKQHHCFIETVWGA